MSRHAPDDQARSGLEQCEALQEEVMRRLEGTGPGDRVRLRGTIELEVEADSPAEAG